MYKFNKIKVITPVLKFSHAGLKMIDLDHI